MDKKVAVIIGSDTDLPVVKGTINTLKMFEIITEVHVMSAHRTPDLTREFARKARENGFGVIIAAAGMSAHLAGAIAANTTLPVIGIPCKASALEGIDALLSTVQMPRGVPVATVAIDGADNAGILAAQILSVYDERIADKLMKLKEKTAREVIEKDEKLQVEMWWKL